ncbi:MAG: 5-carboxymethyl-2-hydroxymuconate isomerase [Gemmatimonadetes bacterium]|jgi:2,4-diketo-3-deoxy-L-fuconate hydrolase|nr:5-carboxymethyl-2-hydroxymuconate isomerase [Gemmatimonadota bacterium]
MKLVTYSAGGEQRVGAVVGDDNNQVVDLAAADRALARREKRKTHAFFSDMLTLLEAGSKGISAAKKAAAAASGASVKPLSKVRLKAPVPNPRKVLCLAGNYQDHIEEGGGKMEKQDKETPRVFMKPPSTTVIGQNDKILIPPVARSIDWEGELAVVIGRKAKGVKPKDALKYVAGYTIMNDVSERDLKIKKRTDSRPRDEWFDWLNGKWLDTFGPQGPWIVTRDEIPDPQKLDISTFINGERKQHNNTGQMLYPVNKIIEYISAIVTLEPGDLISTGTISGVGSTTGTFMKPGDKVQIEISSIGVLKNTVAASKK